MMIDPPGGWKYGFPKYVPMQEYAVIAEYSKEEFEAWLVSNGYPEKDKEIGWKHCRYMTVQE